ncbi:zinc finger protein with KRAB and SCAN domains 7-like [Hemicordylus capensis]|uniref:zinc finger protein with KRAB and SCAN domains 7-like n=1 Tax=Hemicordylus capensis TaxID=884348 RepID=UPI002302D5F9|nr:zinc finger protein with KRAB and SCAN domains 7-like [Hemicordylus capensis]XP_053146161.1 zinc finger protein with KRAB and SCAN domains 7-like [Hemicordylus capensis]XP_053146163.1 zinc finger protein with KRAB and SCAN domains 7-like [Hemicordylus capensis]
MKRKAEIPEGPTAERVPKDSRNGLHVVQAGSEGERLHQVTPQWIKLEPEERQLQCWEAQLQEFLKKVESPPSRSENAEPPSDGKTSLVLSSVYQGAKEAVRLQPLSFGEGDQTASGTLKPVDQEGFRKVKEAILREGTISTEVLRQRFRDFCYQQAGGPRAACSRLQELCHGWLKPERRTKGQMLELVILEQFLSILPLEIQSWVREGQPETCGHAVALAEEFLLQHGEAEREEKQVLGTFEESGVSFSKAGQILLGPGGKSPCREIKQESNGDNRLLGAHTLMNKHSKDRQWAPSETSPHEKEDGIPGNHDGPERQMDHARNQWKNPSATGVAGDLCKTKTSARLPKGMGKHKCLICGKGFTRKSSLNRHHLIHTGVKPHKCSDCGESFYRKTNLLAHEVIHAEEESYNCSDCGESFKPTWGLVSYQRDQTGEKLYRCSVCRKSFGLGADVIRHGLVDALSKEPQGTPLIKSEYEKEEETCGNQDGPEKQVKIKTEDWQNQSVTDLGGELSKMTVPEKFYKGKRKSPCPVCGKIFATQSSVNRHQRIHTGEKPYKCSDCGKTFNQKTSLLTHQVIHTEEKPHKCADCGKSFRHAWGLTVHQRMHTGEKPFQCSICRDYFSQRAHVRRHIMRKHTREKRKTSASQLSDR